VEVAQKQLELLHELVPNTTAMALIVNPANAARAESITREAQDAAHKLGLELHVLHASVERELDAAFASAVRLGAGALVIASDSFFFSVSRSGQLGALALRHAIPAICPYREFAAAGGLISYGTNNADEFRQVGVYTARVLKGEKPADLPVQQATTRELYINLKTAKALGITVPLALSGRADEIFE
jgi:ABC-type uncharacterized transport system substrate-binding protein